MTDEERLNLLLQQLQGETSNCGGQYHFTKIELPSGSSIVDKLKSYLRQYEKYKHPYFFSESQKKEIYVTDRDPENLVLKLVDDFEFILEEKLNYWSNHKTSLDIREQVTELYKPLESQFKLNLTCFLDKIGLVNIYLLSGVDTHYCFGQDHVNDDILIEGNESYFILHFGWSS
ncbi:hypothetical protein ACQ33O_05255 [Ferruginibacter sp. SUN002]|uniref:hypothetical protein n=1 Tax=Ferruginibacter sp. SUN002 TaxID=2937789 RepID=UPI003D35D175